MSPRLSFRTAVAADVPAIVALVESAYRGEASRAGWTTEADFLDGQRTDAGEIAGLLAKPAVRFLLAHDAGGELVASMLLEAEPESAYFGMIAVRPTLQGGGVGAQLLAEGERYARAELGRARGRMRVITLRDTLIAWYLRKGWTLTDKREPFPYGDATKGRPRRDDLEFAVLEKDLQPA